jgi:hypothetical protein
VEHTSASAKEQQCSRGLEFQTEQHKVFLLVQKLKEEAELVSWQMKSKELGLADQKRNKDLSKTRSEN